MNSNPRFGDCLHDAWVNEHEGVKFVQMANEEDSFYCTQFESRAEVEEFILKLRDASDKAFGPENAE